LGGALNPSAYCLWFIALAAKYQLSNPHRGVPRTAALCRVVRPSIALQLRRSSFCAARSVFPPQGVYGYFRSQPLSSPLAIPRVPPISTNISLQLAVFDFEMGLRPSSRHKMEVFRHLWGWILPPFLVNRCRKTTISIPGL
jgi:hypothetical protein